MALLSDNDIVGTLKTGWLKIEPWDVKMLQPASVDVRLGDQIRIFKDWATYLPIDPKEADSDASDLVTIPAGAHFPLGPGQFILGTTLERVTLPDNLGARFEGKSSLGRLGLLTHVTAGFIDPGFTGNITLELHNLRARPLVLWPGMKIGQICFYDLSSRALKPYGQAQNNYQQQSGPVASRAHLQFAED